MDLASDGTPADTGEPPRAAAPQPRCPGVWSGLGIVALYFLLQFGLGIAVVLLIGLAVGALAGVKAALQHRPYDAHAVAQAFQANPDIRVGVAVLTIAAAAALMTLLVRRIWPALWARAELPGFGLVPPASKNAYLGAVLLGIAALLIGGVLTHALAGKHPVQQDIDLMLAKASFGMRLLLAMLVVCVAPWVEELVFRGVLLSGLARRMRVGWAIVASATLFGCVHLPDFGFAWYPVPALILLGLALAWLRVRTRSLWPSITLHATNNLVAVLAWFLSTRPH